MTLSPLSVHQLSMRYQYKPVLTDVSFEIPDGKSVAIIGPNGAGKSTLLKGIMGLAPRIEGDVRFFDADLDKKRLCVAYVPQREEIDWDFPISVMDVVLMGRHGRLKFWQRPSKADRLVAEESLEKVGMSDFKSRQISELSGGQQQRVFIARALSQKASLYLMDEPFSGVDIATEKAIIELFNDLKAEGKTIVVVHHDLTTVKEYFDWSVLINERLIDVGPVDQVLIPENLHKTYGGSLSLLSEMTEQLYRTNMKAVHE